ncbi:atpase family associated with various cellular activities domain-containing protein, partial [Cystoisospora suis]
MVDVPIQSIHITRKYGVSEFREELKNLLKRIASDKKPVSFLLTERQIRNEQFLEDLLSLMNSGEIPDLFDQEERDFIINQGRPRYPQKKEKKKKKREKKGDKMKKAHLSLDEKGFKDMPTLPGAGERENEEKREEERGEGEKHDKEKEERDKEGKRGGEEEGDEEEEEAEEKEEEDDDEEENEKNSIGEEGETAASTAGLTVDLDASFIAAMGGESANLLWKDFTRTIQESLHIILVLSPLGKPFRSRCRRFPGLLSCASIDFYDPWPREGILSVAKHFYTQHSTKRRDKLANANTEGERNPLITTKALLPLC